MVNKQIVVLVISVVVLKCIDSQTLPAYPCANSFQYFQNSDIVYGRMQFPNDLSGNYRLSVNMSVATHLTDNKNISLELRTSANELSEGRSVVYHVYFPIQSVIPKPTRIEFNGKVYCAEPPEESRPEREVTVMGATTYFTTTPSSGNEVDTKKAPLKFFFTIGAPPSSNHFQLPTQPPASETNDDDGNPLIQFFRNIQTNIADKNPFAQFFGTGTTNVVDTNRFNSFITTPKTPPSERTVVNGNQFNPFITTPKSPSSVTTVVDRNPNLNQFSSTPKTPPSETTVDDKNSNLNEHCGLSSVTSQHLVVNGDKVQEGQFPWMVAIMYRQNSDYKYRCTGSLVSNQHVITAAHCVQFFKAPLVPIEDLLLVLGKNEIKNWANGAVIRDVQNMTVHPDYKQNQGDCDIAVLTMSKPIEFQASIRPVCIWQADEDLDLIVGKEGTVIGWGMDETGKNFVTEAKRINLPIVSQVTCLRSDPRFSAITSRRTFCAGNRNGSGPCTGDSGAGFIMNQGGKWILRGVVSTALGDGNACDLNNYFVFVDAAKLKSWIIAAMA